METVPVRSAADMAEAILSRRAAMDVVVMAAAVADYRPVKHEQKLKKARFDGVLSLERTTDILAELGKDKRYLLAGFAAESERLLDNARDKLARKNLDLIFANDISKETLGFGTEENHLLAIDRNGKTHDLGTRPKDELAREIVALTAAAMV